MGTPVESSRVFDCMQHKNGCVRFYVVETANRDETRSQIRA